MNAKQRYKNRTTAQRLAWLIHNSQECPNCGKKGAHWFTMPQTLLEAVKGYPVKGYWTCEAVKEWENVG